MLGDPTARKYAGPSARRTWVANRATLCASRSPRQGLPHPPNLPMLSGKFGAEITPASSVPARASSTVAATLSGSVFRYPITFSSSFFFWTWAGLAASRPSDLRSAPYRRSSRPPARPTARPSNDREWKHRAPCHSNESPACSVPSGWQTLKPAGPGSSPPTRRRALNQTRSCAALLSPQYQSPRSTVSRPRVLPALRHRAHPDVQQGRGLLAGLFGRRRLRCCWSGRRL